MWDNQFGRQQNANTIQCILVPTMSQFDQVALSPGQKIIVMSQSEPVFALKTSNEFGFISTKYCKFSEYEPVPAQTQTTDFESRLKRLEELLNGKSFNANDGQQQPNVPACTAGTNA